MEIVDASHPWNSLNLYSLSNLVRLIQDRGTPSAVVLLPQGVSPWLVAGEVREAITPTGSSDNNCSSSSECGAEDIDFGDAHVYFYVIPNTGGESYAD